jgi:hypothetical protein
MGLTHTVYQSFSSIPPAQWQSLTAGNTDLAFDPRLLGAMESNLRDYPFFSIVIHDDASPASASAAAIAFTWLFPVDLKHFAWMRWLTKLLPRPLHNLLRFNILFCGLPLPAGKNQLLISPDADQAAVIAELNRALRLLAKQQKAGIIVIKEFTASQCEQLNNFSDAGFLKSQIPPLHCLSKPFTSFQDYLNSLRSRYRAEINRSIKKFTAAGFRAEQVYGPDRLPEVLTDDAHKLYCAVRDRSKYKLEFLSADFLRDLGRRFGPDASLTCIYLDQRLAGFTLGLMHNGTYFNMNSGLDYELNPLGDVYFNLFYNDLDFAWKRGAKQIDLGLTSDDFKSRLGTEIEPLYLFIDARRWLISRGLKISSPWSLPPLKPVESHDVFKTAPPEATRRRNPARSQKIT